ncbi:putative Sieve element occlusion e [Hibiscus syriacus]|uniref:Sieve element occlusion e n=1 Tax=Hibiscus syriacus TaxID=106335 RepID=A0A6A3ANR9_HIBSY|nr:putative Sieve element occlusion e [Hibiscus syriacus]
MHFHGSFNLPSFNLFWYHFPPCSRLVSRETSRQRNCICFCFELIRVHSYDSLRRPLSHRHHLPMTSVQRGSFWQHSSSYVVDEVLIKKLLLSHDPDRRRLNSEMLLSAVENIMFYATTSEEPVTPCLVSDESDKANLKSNIGNIELIESPEPLMHTIYKVAHEMLCKCPGKGDLHTRTMALFDLLGSHRWDAKVALAMAAFATSYGEFSLIMQLRPHIPLAVSVANFKQLPSNMRMLKPQLNALRLLFKTMVDLTKCVIEFEALYIVHVGLNIDNLATMKSKIYVTAYWIIRSTLVCSSQITSLMAMKPEQVHVLTSNFSYFCRYSNIKKAALELLSLEYMLSNMYRHLRPLVDACCQQREDQLNQKLLNFFKKSHIDNQEVLRMLSSSIRAVVFLVNQTYDHPHREKVEGSYAIIWVPISSSEVWTNADERWFNFLSNSVPFYSVRKPWSLNSTVINFMKQEWNYRGEAIMVVLDSEGTITSSNALDMVFIWGPRAYPFSLSRENELWDGQQWTIQFITNEILPILTQRVEEGRNICLYGSENLDWIKEFNAKMKDIKDAGMQLAMIYVECMRRSKSRLGNDGSTEPTDHVLVEVLALLHNIDTNGWAVFGKGSSTDVVKVRGDEIIRCSNLFRQWGDNVARLEFIDALRTVLEPPLVEGPCDHTQVVPYSEGLRQGNIVCHKCKRLMKKFIVFE